MMASKYRQRRVIKTVTWALFLIIILATVVIYQMYQTARLKKSSVFLGENESWSVTITSRLGITNDNKVDFRAIFLYTGEQSPIPQKDGELHFSLSDRFYSNETHIYHSTSKEDSQSMVKQLDERTYQVHFTLDWPDAADRESAGKTPEQYREFVEDPYRKLEVSINGESIICTQQSWIYAFFYEDPYLNE